MIRLSTRARTCQTGEMFFAAPISLTERRRGASLSSSLPYMRGWAVPNSATSADACLRSSKLATFPFSQFEDEAHGRPGDRDADSSGLPPR